MKYTRQIARAGLSMEVETRARSREGRTGRLKNQNPTPEAVQKYNEKQAEKYLRLLIAQNFGEGSGHYVLSYEGEIPDIQETRKKIIPNFIKRIGRRMKKKGKELKYIIATEYEVKRIHHHIIINTLDVETVNNAWGMGFVRVTPLDKNGDFRRLAEYIIKETKKTFRLYKGKRYNPSRNLERPKFEKPKGVKKWDADKPPRQYKGYRLVDWYITVNPVTGYLHQFAYYLKWPEWQPRKKGAKKE